MNELPKRKSIRIEDFDYSTTGAFFIAVCTANRDKLFWSDRRGRTVFAHKRHRNGRTPRPYSNV